VSDVYCMENNWRCALTLKLLIRFNRPYPIKETFLEDDPRKGSFLHGALLMEGKVDEILEQAEDYQ
jgi:hypothetical protein